jgi:hypothetical protein
VTQNSALFLLAPSLRQRTRAAVQNNLPLQFGDEIGDLSTAYLLAALGASEATRLCPAAAGLRRGLENESIISELGN